MKTLPKISRGFTLIELAVVMTIAVILAMYSVPAYNSVIERYRTTNAANDFLRALMLARSQATSSGERVVVAPLTADGDWRNGWHVFIDVDNDGLYTAGTDRDLQVFNPIIAGFAISTVGTFGDSTHTFVSYNALGFPRAPNGSTMGNSLLTLQLGDTTRSVCIDLMGRSKVVKGTSCT